ncbi:MAG: diaminopimelate epimerase [Pseudonocardia sp.]|nr:diaminopimelate epimerase [Pseudonocardia sp.]
MRFAKGHGTENDFVLLLDADGRLDLTPERVRALCERRGGLGADGVLRVVRASAVGEPAQDGVEWFMDYRNSDGSTAEMCGNGARVFARYLAECGLVGGGALLLGTRGGVRRVWFTDDGLISVDMGPARIGVPSTATVDGRAFDGVEVDLGNPHLACVTEVALDSLDLAVPPGRDPALFPHGVNVEFVTAIVDGEVSMRVHERGAGETRSCGTGTVAAVVAALRHAGQEAGSCVVHTPGGRLHVSVTRETTTLTGPAVIVAQGELDSRWWESVPRAG